MLASDGLEERRNRDGEMLGSARVARLLGRVGYGSAAEILAHLLDAAEVWGDGVPAEDDLTIVVVKRT